MTEAGLGEQLHDLGFGLGSVYEAIITTLCPDGSPNASPMGVIRNGPSTLEIRPFKTSTTFWNLLRHRKACINLTDDPAFYLVTAFKDENFQGFVELRVDSDLRLESSDAHVFVDVQDFKEISGIRASFTCNVSSVEVRNPTPRVFSRGKAEAIEAIIHATRIEVFAREGRWEQVERLISGFYACKDVVGRVSAPGSTEARVIEELERLIGTWRETESRST